MGELREVELVEVGDAPVEAPPSSSHRRRGWIAVAVVAVAALVVGGQAVLDGRHRAALAQFDDVPGVLLPVPHHPQVAWTRTRSRFEPRLEDAVEVDGLLVSGTVTHGRYAIVGTERSTGATRWTVQGPTDSPDETTAMDKLGLVAAASCAPLGGDALAACAIGQIRPGTMANDAEPTRMLVIDTHDGTVVSSRRTPLRSWVVVGAAVVAATSETTNDTIAWTLEATDAQGSRLWTHALPAVPVMKYSGDLPDYATSLSAASDRVGLTSDGHLWLIEDGAVVGDRRVEDLRSYDLQGGGIVMSVPDDTEDGAPSTEPTGYISLDGHWTPLVGAPVYATVDDGSADDVVLSADDVIDADEHGALVAHDATTGDLRWSRPADLVSNAVILGGTVYVVVSPDVLGNEQDLVALDARTGQERWSHRLPDDPATIGNITPATDGRAIYALGAATGVIVAGDPAIDPFGLGAPTPVVDVPGDSGSAPAPALPDVPAFAIDDGTALTPVALPSSLPADASPETRSGLLVVSRYDDDSGRTTVQVLG